MTSFGKSAGEAKESFLRPYYLATRYLARNPASTTALHLRGLLAERLDLMPEAVKCFEKSAQGLEAEYELRETAIIEQQYIIANSSLGRARLPLDDNDGALRPLEAVLGLLQVESTRTEELESSLLSVQGMLTKALALHFANEAQDSLQCFEKVQKALQAMQGDKHKILRLRTQATLLLARILYALGGQEQQAEAGRQLLD